MHRLSLLIPSLLAASPLLFAQSSTGAGDIVTRLVGTWTLVKYESFDQNGNPTGRGYDSGRITYDEHGNMAAQLARKGRPVVTRQSSDADRLAAAAGYVAYFGTYRVDETKEAIMHDVISSTITTWEGTTVVRYYEFSADSNTLTLSLKNGERVTGRLTWSRLKGK